MARVPLTEVVLLATNPATFAQGATVYVYKRGTKTPVTVYDAESGGSTLSQPLVTDAGGRIEGSGDVGWVEEGSYDLSVNGQTVPWEASRGDADVGDASKAEVEAEEAARKAVGDKLDNLAIFNVKDYGAKGDGATVDRTSIQEAVDAAEAAGGGVVYLPDGTYILSGTLTVDSDGIALVGAGAATVLKLQAGGNDELITVDAGASDLLFRDFTLDGNRANQETEKRGLLIEGDGSDNIVVERLRIKDVLGKGINVSQGEGKNTTGLRIEGNYITNCSDHAIQAEWNCPGVQVLNNKIEETDAEANGVWIGNESDHAVVSGNVITAVGDMGIEVWHNTGGHASVIGNTVEESGGFGISIARTANSTVTGNTVDTPTDIGIEISESDDCAVSGNTVNDSTGDGITLNGSSEVSITSRAAVTGNTIKNAATAAIQLSGTAGGEARGEGHEISGNTIYGTDTAESGLADVRILVSLFKNVVVANNHIVKTTSGKAIGVPDGGVCFANRIEYVGALTGEAITAAERTGGQIVGNHISGTFTTGINIASSASVLVAGNRISGSTGTGIGAAAASATCLISGNLVEKAGGATFNFGSAHGVGNLDTGASTRTYTPTKMLFGSEIEVDGDLNHDGTKVGLFGTAPAAQPEVKKEGLTADELAAALAGLGIVAIEP